MRQIQVVHRPIGEFRPNDYNPNRQDKSEFALLCKSIQDDGMTQPIIATPDGTIIDGEHRWRACKKLGHATIPVVLIDMDDARRRIATLRHNRARGTHDAGAERDVFRYLYDAMDTELLKDAMVMDDDQLGALLQDVVQLPTIEIPELEDDKLITIRLVFEPDEYALIESAAESAGKTVADIITYAIDDYIRALR